MADQNKKNFILDAIMFILMCGLVVSGGEGLHTLFGFLLAILVVIHLAWHWKHIKKLYNNMFETSRKRNVATALFVIFAVATLLSPVFIPDERHEPRQEFSSQPVLLTE